MMDSRMSLWTFSVVALVTLMSVLSEGEPLNCEGIPSSCECETKVKQQREVLIIDCSNSGLDSIPNLNSYIETETPIEILLNGNSITSINNYAFNSIRIRKINVANNSIESISSKAFKSLEETLEELIIANNTQLRELPEAIKTMTMLTKLDASNILLTQIQEGNNNPLANLRELKHLDLSYNTLEIPVNTRVYGAMGNLKYLNLAEMGLSAIPTAIINNTPKLERLIFRKNNLATYTESLSDSIPRLIELDLSKNPVSYDDTRPLFSGYPNLAILKVSGGELNRINANALSRVPKLTQLTLANLNIEHVDPNAFNQLTKMRHLDIGQNPFNLTDTLFSKMANTLQSLSIIDMRLDKYPRALLASMTKLREIHLEQNRIVTLEQGQFNGLTRKNVKIYFGNNQLKTIHQKVLEDAPIPVHLYLQDNNITTLGFLNANACDFKDMTVDVTGNNIMCDCTTFKMVQQKVVDLIGECGSPANYNGLKLTYKPTTATTAAGSATTPAPSPADLTRQYFEMAARVACKSRDRSAQEYSCTCKSWNNIGSARACPAVSGSPSSISWTAFIFLNIITIGSSVLFTNMSR